MANKTPTNSDLAKRIDDRAKELKKELTEMNVILLEHDKNLKTINKRHELADFAKKVIEEHDKQQRVDEQTKVQDGIMTYQLKAWHLIVGILAIASAILYAIAASRGIKP